MSFEDLELRLLENGNFDRYTKDCEEIARTPRNIEQVEMLKYFLATNNAVESNGQGNNMLTIGGYAVLSYLVGEFGEKIIGVWRGSHDLDLVAKDPSVLSIIMGAFDQRLKRPSNAIPQKYSLEVQDKDTKLDELICQIDLYPCWGSPLKINQREICSDFFDRAEHPMIYGMPVTVPEIVELIKLKVDVETYVGNLRLKDKGDIIDLVSVLVNRNVSAAKLYRSLDEKENAILVKELFGQSELPLVTANAIEGREYTQKAVEKFAGQYVAYHNKTISK